MSRVYFDHASAAPWHPAALAATLHVAQELPGDPARGHAEGRAARDLLESARAALGGALGASALAFTSGGTEAVHLAVRGVALARPGRIVSSAVEYSAVHAAAEATGREHVLVGVDGEGRVDLDQLAAALRGGAALVNLQHANHEVGTLQPVAEAAALLFWFDRAPAEIVCAPVDESDALSFVSVPAALAARAPPAVVFALARFRSPAVAASDMLPLAEV